MKKLLMLVALSAQINCMEKNPTTELLLEKLPARLIVPILAQVAQKEINELGGIAVVKKTPVKNNGNLLQQNEEYWHKLFSCPVGLRMQDNDIYYKDKKIIKNTYELQVWGPNKQGIMLINDTYIFKVDLQEITTTTLPITKVHPFENQLVRISSPNYGMTNGGMPILGNPYPRIFTHYEVSGDSRGIGCYYKGEHIIKFLNFWSCYSYDLLQNDSFLAIDTKNQKICSVARSNDEFLPVAKKIISLKKICKSLSLDGLIRIDSFEQMIENPQLFLIYLKQTNNENINYTILCKRANNKAKIIQGYTGHIQFFGQQCYRWRYLNKANSLPDGYLKIMPIEEYVAQMKTTYLSEQH